MTLPNLSPHSPIDRFNEAGALVNLLRILRLRRNTNKTYATVLALMEKEIQKEIDDLMKLGIHEYQQDNANSQ